MSAAKSPVLKVFFSTQNSLTLRNPYTSKSRDNWSISILLFPEKEAKSVSSASQKANVYPEIGETDPRGSAMYIYLCIHTQDTSLISIEYINEFILHA
jgi:hypothetical protein